MGNRRNAKWGRFVAERDAMIGPLKVIAAGRAEERDERLEKALLAIFAPGKEDVRRIAREALGEKEASDG